MEKIVKMSKEIDNSAKEKIETKKELNGNLVLKSIIFEMENSLNELINSLEKTKERLNELGHRSVEIIKSRSTEKEIEGKKVTNPSDLENSVRQPNICMFVFQK